MSNVEKSGSKIPEVSNMSNDVFKDRRHLQRLRLYMLQHFCSERDNGGQCGCHMRMRMRPCGCGCGCGPHADGSKVRTPGSGQIRFLQNPTTSEALRKFSRRRRHMFRVSRRSAQIRAFERTNIYGHTTHSKKNFAELRFFLEKKYLRGGVNLTFLITIFGSFR